MITFDEIMNFDPKNEVVFEELFDLCINKKIVPYIGAGLSAFRFPIWDKYINEKKSCLGDKAKGMNNIDATEAIEKKLGKDVFYKHIQTTYGGDLDDIEWECIIKKAEDKDNGEAVSVIPKLFFGPIITTNFDRILEQIHRNISDFDVALPNNLNEKITQNKQKRLLYKIHGCVSDKNIVFTKRAYNSAYKRDSKLVQSLITLFQGFHFLFLGCSLAIDVSRGGTKEPYMELWERLRNSGTQHFAIINCQKEQLEKRRKELEVRNIHPIFYESEQHVSVKIILDRLLENIKEFSPNFPHNETSYIDREDGIYDFNLGFGNIQIANYDKALEHIEKSIETFERYYTEATNNAEVTIIANNLLNIYTYKGVVNIFKAHYEKAIEIFNMCINLGKQMRIKRALFSEESLAKTYMNRGIAYEYIKKHKEALCDKSKNITILEQLYNRLNNTLALAYMNRGMTYLSMNEYKKALSDTNRSIEIWERMINNGELVNMDDLAKARMNIGIIQSKKTIVNNKNQLVNEANKISNDATLKYNEKQKDIGKNILENLKINFNN